ncbi:MAG TPA: hypothetical protein EYG07_00655 [Alphaproteobacteria bacterium]|jgi:hypothetical protein|nr:hypothetical protein [Alphaproteobacteria bacterium]
MFQKEIKYFIGPMSKNIVDAIVEFDGDFGFIPSRRQVDYNGGYVNDWSTDKFAKYVNGRAPIQRDHGGIGQGYKDDDGYESFLHDSRHFNIIHVDPWKHYDILIKGLEETVRNIKFIHSNNSDMKFEVGTEEAIKRFNSKQMELMLRYLEEKLEPKIFENIEYTVVQSGVGLDLGKQSNTGTYNPDRLEEMIHICRKFGKKSKEHNGDYLSTKEYKDRFDLGLDAINIAPEFGQLETLCYLDEMGDNIEDYYQICYDSKRWEKWVGKDFVPEDNKRELIKICGHYVFSNKQFLNIKPNIDSKIKKVIKDKLVHLSNA